MNLSSTALILLTTLIALASSIQTSDIYGVRWFLGETFRFQEPVTKRKEEASHSDLLVFFNAYSIWEDHNFSVSIGSESYECFQVVVDLNITANHHANFNEFASKKGESFTYYIYKCPISFIENSFLENVSTFEYNITAKNIQQNTILFHSKLRSPAYNKKPISITVFGDWGVLSNFSKQSQISEPIDKCLMKEIEQNEDVRLMLLLGDLAYDLQGLSYINFFKYLQPYSEKIVILFTPGNHESIKHKDIFQLVKQSFYSPFWSHFYGYFDLVAIGRYVFLGYSTQHLFPSLARDSHSSLYQVYLKEDYGDYYNLFTMQLTQESKQKLKSHVLIGYSHYPTICSEDDEHENCTNYRVKHQPYLDHLQDAGMSLFFSGHLHVYQRSKQICHQETRLKSRDHLLSEYSISRDCTIFIIQGVAGNNYFVQSSRHCNIGIILVDLKNQSEKYIDNTGFGVLTLNYQDEDTYFKHVVASKECKIGDSFILSNPEQVLAEPLISKDQVNFTVISLVILIIIVGVILACYIYRIILKRRIPKHKKLEKLSTKSHANVLELAQAQTLN